MSGGDAKQAIFFMWPYMLKDRCIALKCLKFLAIEYINIICYFFFLQKPTHTI